MSAIDFKAIIARAFEDLGMVNEDLLDRDDLRAVMRAVHGALIRDGAGDEDLLRVLAQFLVFIRRQRTPEMTQQDLSMLYGAACEAFGFDFDTVMKKFKRRVQH